MIRSYRERSPERPEDVERCSKVFVYGTLMSGFRNHEFLQGCKKVCDAKTVEHFQMQALHYPWLLRNHSPSTEIIGEVYEIDASVLVGLDHLEGYPTLFTRDVIGLTDLEEPGRAVAAWAYLRDPNGPRYELPKGAEIVAGGDYRAWARVRQHISAE